MYLEAFSFYQQVLSVSLYLEMFLTSQVLASCQFSAQETEFLHHMSRQHYHRLSQSSSFQNLNPTEREIKGYKTLLQ